MPNTTPEPQAVCAPISRSAIFIIATVVRGEGKAEGQEHRVHQMSILTMRMIIAMPMATEMPAPIRANTPGARSIGSR